MMFNFKKAYLEITNICNLSCGFCPKTKRKPAFMDAKQFECAVQSIKPHTRYLYFHLMGEPFLHSRLNEFLQICEQHEMKVNITTNGTLIKQVQNTLLNTKALRKVSFSLHSFEANDCALDFNNYIQDILNFSLLASRNNIICELRLWNNDGAQLKGENKLNEQIIQMIQSAFSLNFDLSTHPTKTVKVGDKIFLGQAEKFAWPDMNLDVLHQSAFCYGLRDQFGVLVDGTVVPCCLDQEGNIPLGNLFDTPLDQILMSERARAIYDGFSARNAVEPLCQRCGYAARYERKNINEN